MIPCVFKYFCLQQNCPIKNLYRYGCSALSVDMFDYQRVHGSMLNGPVSNFTCIYGRFSWVVFLESLYILLCVYIYRGPKRVKSTLDEIEKWNMRIQNTCIFNCTYYMYTLQYIYIYIYFFPYVICIIPRVSQPKAVPHHSRWFETQLPWYWDQG